MGDASLTALLMLYYAVMRLMLYYAVMRLMRYCTALLMLYYQAHAQRGMDGRRLPHCNFQHERRARVCCLMR
jgi:hypothetical protein